MIRQRALQVVMLVLGLLFCGMIYPLKLFVLQEPPLAMMLSLYVTLGILLLLAVRNPSAHRSLIAFTAWSSLAHASVMAYQAFHNAIPRGQLRDVGVFVLIGIVLILLAPPKQPVAHASPAAA